jgi:hypothetical protein
MSEKGGPKSEKRDVSKCLPFGPPRTDMCSDAFLRHADWSENERTTHPGGSFAPASPCC